MSKSTAITTNQPAVTRISGEYDPVESSNIRSREPTAMQVFFAWEKLRFYYNVLLLISTFYIVIPSVERIGGITVVFIPEVLLMPLIWNVLFCVGPVLEGYLCLCRVPRLLARLMALIGGTVIVIFITCTYAKTWT